MATVASNVLLMLVAALASAAALLLAGAGIAKIARPEAAVATMRSVAPATPPAAGRVLGVAEVVLAAGFLVSWTPLSAVLLGGGYACLAGFVLVARDKARDCGCFGTSSAPIGRAHVVACFVMAVGALGAAVWHVETLGAAERAIAVAGGLGLALVAYGAIGPAASLRAELAGIGR
jgi:hypothetical protein